MRNYTKDQDYMGNINLAISETDPAQKIEYIKKAINIDPTRRESYFGKSGHESDNLIDLYVSDVNGEGAYFTMDKEADFREFLKGGESEQSLRTVWQDQDWYPELAQKIGELYWYNYTGKIGDTEEERWRNSASDRQKLASGWFADVVDLSSARSNEKYNTIEAFRDIGEFAKSMQSDGGPDTDPDPGTYKEQWNTLNRAFDSVHEGNGGTPRARLSVDNVIVNSIITYAYQFANDGVTVDEMREQLAAIRRDVEGMEGISAENDALSDSMRNDLLGKFQQVSDLLDKIGA
jgi:hypothetical protein